MSTRKRPRPAAVCGACKERIEAASIDALNAKLVKHYRKCRV